MSQLHAKDVPSVNAIVLDQRNAFVEAVKRFREEHPCDQPLSRRQKKNLQSKARIAVALHSATVAELYCSEAVEPRKIEESARFSVERSLCKAKSERDRALRELKDLKEVGGSETRSPV